MWFSASVVIMSGIVGVAEGSRPLQKQLDLETNTSELTSELIWPSVSTIAYPGQEVAIRGTKRKKEYRLHLKGPQKEEGPEGPEEEVKEDEATEAPPSYEDLTGIPIRGVKGRGFPQEEFDEDDIEKAPEEGSGGAKQEDIEDKVVQEAAETDKDVGGDEDSAKKVEANLAKTPTKAEIEDKCPGDRLRCCIMELVSDNSGKSTEGFCAATCVKRAGDKEQKEGECDLKRLNDHPDYAKYRCRIPTSTREASKMCNYQGRDYDWKTYDATGKGLRNS